MSETQRHRKYDSKFKACFLVYITETDTCNLRQTFWKSSKFHQIPIALCVYHYIQMDSKLSKSPLINAILSLIIYTSTLFLKKLSLYIYRAANENVQSLQVTTYWISYKTCTTIRVYYESRIVFTIIYLQAIQHFQMQTEFLILKMWEIIN